jgi:hypothetical protein
MLLLEGTCFALFLPAAGPAFESVATLLPFSWFACDAAGGITYSYLSATMGSTFIARRAGMQQASSATMDRIAATATNVNGS